MHDLKYSRVSSSGSRSDYRKFNMMIHLL